MVLVCPKARRRYTHAGLEIKSFGRSENVVPRVVGDRRKNPRDVGFRREFRQARRAFGSIERHVCRDVKIAHAQEPPRLTEQVFADYYTASQVEVITSRVRRENRVL